MAATRLIALHKNKGKSVAACLKSRTDYAQNPDKTEQGQLVSSYKCSPLTVDEEFMLSKRQYELVTGRRQKNDVIAYQIRQSFKPGEITAEEANKVGYELAMRFTKGKYAFLVATHTDREHIHNHIIYNSTALDCSRKFRDFLLSGLAVQRLSDLICLEHSLSVIEIKPYRERQKRVLYPPKESNRDQLCGVIDSILADKPGSYEEFLKKLEQQGYEVKRGKFTSVKGVRQKRFIRFRTLGAGYSEEELKAVLAGEAEHCPRKKHPVQEQKFQLLVDIQAKLAEGKGDGYARWAKRYNLKEMSKPMFDNNKLGEIRPNQLITTFGPGSIVDAVKDSVTVLDLNYWKEKGKKIIDGRLASYLGVDCFYMPRTSYSGDIPVVSFPYMHVCSNVKCGRIFDLRENFDLDRYLKFGVTCPECHRQAYPSRFITICENGHMDDFPWSWWVHGGNTTCKGTMRMYSTGNTSTLADMWVECSCGARRSMSGATQHENFEGMKCSGHHPFRPNHKNEKCDKEMIPSQRGASNVYFPVMRSAISIPPWINPLYNLIDEHLRLIDSYEEDFGEMGLDKAYQKYFSAFTREEFDAALLRRRQNIKEFTEIKQMEYNAITHHADPVYASNKKHFKAEEDPLPDYLLPYFKRVIRITRLREVRVLLGFTRVDAPDPDADEQTNIVYLNKGKTEKWLPAAEVHGEGVFIEFNRDSIDAWLRDSELGALSQKYAQCYKEFCESKEWTVTTLRDARYVLMHTFAHLLIKQMSMSSGYSSSAIRERIYFGDDMSGVLLYTGSADKEGSLGGLVELGNIDQLIVLMKDAFQEALVCTNDPECLNNVPAGNNSNGAACHSCCMISETACENGNRMLDRGLIVPIDGRENQSYFKTLVEELCQLEV